MCLAGGISYIVIGPLGVHYLCSVSEKFKLSVYYSLPASVYLIASFKCSIILYSLMPFSCIATLQAQ